MITPRWFDACHAGGWAHGWYKTMHWARRDWVGLRRQRRTGVLWGFWWAACWTEVSDLIRSVKRLTQVKGDSVAQWCGGTMLTVAGHEASYIDEAGHLVREKSFSTASVVSDSSVGAIGWIKGLNEWFRVVSAHHDYELLALDDIVNRAMLAEKTNRNLAKR